MANPEDSGQWQTLGREYLYESPWCSFRVDEARLPDGAEIEYGILESAGFAAVVPGTESGDGGLVRQGRQPVEGDTLGLPGGGGERGADPRAAASRGLIEGSG